MRACPRVIALARRGTSGAQTSAGSMGDNRFQPAVQAPRICFDQCGHGRPTAEGVNADAPLMDLPQDGSNGPGGAGSQDAAPRQATPAGLRPSPPTAPGPTAPPRLEGLEVRCWTGYRRKGDCFAVGRIDPEPAAGRADNTTAHIMVAHAWRQPAAKRAREARGGAEARGRRPLAAAGGGQGKATADYTLHGFEGTSRARLDDDKGMPLLVSRRTILDSQKKVGDSDDDEDAMFPPL
ncbi:unnamed protein product, partial [Prorocentrum cordatum]